MSHRSGWGGRELSLAANLDERARNVRPNQRLNRCMQRAAVWEGHHAVGNNNKHCSVRGRHSAHRKDSVLNTFRQKTELNV